MTSLASGDADQVVTSPPASADLGAPVAATPQTADPALLDRAAEYEAARRIAAVSRVEAVLREAAKQPAPSTSTAATSSTTTSTSTTTTTTTATTTTTTTVAPPPEPVAPAAEPTTLEPAPEPTAPEPTAPASTVPASTVPVSTVPVSTVPASTVPEPPAPTGPQSEGQPFPPAPPGGDPSPEQWAALRYCESQGNYQIVSASGRFRGAYQFLQSTWDSVASRYYPRLIGIDPAAAAPADQDRQAFALWRIDGRRPWPVCGIHLVS
ncbi:MAG: hypothetical protein HKN26_16600 [Acidimicrobiales bacterium]|nr:hypothetical protein [Acidimicrobiales bacterium]